MTSGFRIGQLVKVRDNFWAKGYRKRVGIVIEKKRWPGNYRFSKLAGKTKYCIKFSDAPYNNSGRADMFGLVDLEPLTKQEKFLWEMRRVSSCLWRE